MQNGCYFCGVAYDAGDWYLNYLKKRGFFNVSALNKSWPSCPLERVLNILVGNEMDNLSRLLSAKSWLCIKFAILSPLVIYQSCANEYLISIG